MRRIAFAIAALTAAITPAAAQQADTPPVFQFEGLEPSDYPLGTRQYLVYVQRDGAAPQMTMLWERTMRVTEIDGVPMIETLQSWHGEQDVLDREVYSLNRLEDFSPVYHRSERGDGVIEAFRFEDGQVIGDDSVEGNAKVDFRAEMSAATLNWELDLETFSLLPLEAGVTVWLDFHHPGADAPPQPYRHDVIGEETLTGPMGEPIDTWMLEIDHGPSQAVFWVSKETGQVIKSKDSFSAGARYKVLLATVSQAPSHALDPNTE